MKTKLNFLIIGAIFAFGLVGFIFFSQFSQSKKDKTSNNLKSEKQTNEKQNPEKKFSSKINLKEALNTGVICQTEANGGRSTLYFKGDNMKMVLEEEGKKTNGLILEKKEMYYWDERSREGFKISYQVKQKDNKLEGSGSFFPGMNFNFSMDKVDSTQDLSDFEKEINGQCQVKEIADSEFELPKGVTFSDFSSFKGD